MRVSEITVALVALMKLKGVGRRSALRIVGQSPSDWLDNGFQDYVISNAERAKLSRTELVKAWALAGEELEDAFDRGFRSFSIYEQSYPYRLKNIPDPPAVIFAKGELAWIDVADSIAIVGTREPTPYGQKVARKSAATAAEAGFAIVSGLAHGCDTLAHEGCLDADGVGIAVLAHGLDKIYPAANRSLADRLLEHRGCLLSEYPLGFKPLKTSFAERDRIQSGLADGVLVIETDVTGGTMHTVRFSREQKRALACVDHPETLRHEDKTKGNQKLIADDWAVPIPDGQALSSFLKKLKDYRAGAASKLDPVASGDQLSLRF